MKTRHYSHHKYKHNISNTAKTFSYFILPLSLITFIFIYFSNSSNNIFISNLFNHSNIIDTLNALLSTLYRLVTAYILAIIIGIPLAMLATKNKKIEEFLLPVFDVLESIPVLVFFPVVIIFFIKMNMLNSAAIFIIFLNMLWNIVFSAIGGLKSIPKDIFYVAKAFKISGLSYFIKIILPAIFPVLVTGSILAWAEGWNMIIVAEVLRTYVPSSIAVPDLYGIGSTLVNASTSGDTLRFIICVFFIIFSIIILNLFVWQKLLKYSEKFKFE